MEIVALGCPDAFRSGRVAPLGVWAIGRPSCVLACALWRGHAMWVRPMGAGGAEVEGFSAIYPMCIGYVFYMIIYTVFFTVFHCFYAQTKNILFLLFLCSAVTVFNI